MKIRPEYFRSEYVVGGTGRFPFDMLRYDKACPATEGDTLSMNRSGPRQVCLHRFTSEPTTKPAHARWRSYGWHVLEVTLPDGETFDFPEAVAMFGKSHRAKTVDPDDARADVRAEIAAERNRK